MDRELSWRLNIRECLRKGSVALYCCRGAIGKRWSPSPKVIVWLYETVVKLGKATLAKQLECAQRGDPIGICGALRTALTIALSIFTHIAPVDITVTCIAAKPAIRVKEIEYMKSHNDTFRNPLSRVC